MSKSQAKRRYRARRRERRYQRWLAGVLKRNRVIIHVKSEIPEKELAEFRKSWNAMVAANNIVSFRAPVRL